MALSEVSERVAGAHDTDEVLDLIVNEAAGYLKSIASGSNPSTFRQTAQTLKSRATPENT